MGASLTRRLFLLIVIGGAVAVFLYVLHIEKRGGTAEELTPHDRGSGEDILVEGVRHFDFDADGLRWAIQAKTARFFQAGNIIRFETITATVYPASGGMMVLEASEGYYDTATGNIGVEGNVRGRSDQGYVFNTDRLTYEAASRRIHSTDKVTLQKDRLTIKGMGLEGALDTRTIRVLSSVEATTGPH